VTDVGGPLSHSSIVAREYHSPAVLETGVATERLSSARASRSMGTHNGHDIHLRAVDTE
jgi:phosphoenolpyruvate synthase/pyruvate phosphate dikinase